MVHNGIIENYESLRSELTAQGYVFTSDTDTESIAHLVEFEVSELPSSPGEGKPCGKIAVLAAGGVLDNLPIGIGQIYSRFEGFSTRSMNLS